VPKYLVQNSYTAEGMRGLMAEGGSSRRDAAAHLIESLGGKLESFYFSLGSDDMMLICDLPDDAAVISALGTVAASGAMGSATVTTLVSAESMDDAAKRAGSYRPPES
jgi:uncharacterized protein with GYD domain